VELVRTRVFLGVGGGVASLGRHLDVYDPRTSGGSTLSALVYGRLAHRQGRREAAWARFEETLSADFSDIQDGTTAEGIHVGAMAGSVLWVLEDFAGIETRGERLAIRPAPPAHWRRLGCRFHYRGSRFALELDLASAEPTVTLHHLEGAVAQEVELAGQVVTLEPGQRRKVALAGGNTGLP
jgi:trehalose/maltose hydrolase-like predicted phosphorylase